MADRDARFDSGGRLPTRRPELSLRDGALQFDHVYRERLALARDFPGFPVEAGLLGGLPLSSSCTKDTRVNRSAARSSRWGSWMLTGFEQLKGWVGALRSSGHRITAGRAMFFASYSDVDAIGSFRPGGLASVAAADHAGNSRVP
jgi:hypothetical protein